MKVALLFSGQIRGMPADLFKKSLSLLTEDLNYEIYSYFWEETGKSLNHGLVENKISKTQDAKVLFEQLFNGFNLKSFKSEPYLNFREKLNPTYQKIIDSKEYHFGTINSLAQIYSLSQCYKLLLNDLSDFDLIFKCRFDSLFVHPLILFDLEKIKNDNKLRSLNFGRAFYPNRIYDIFFGGSKKSMAFLYSIWDELPYLLNDDFENNLDKRDSCRLFYLSAIKKGIKVTSFETRICDIFRNFKNNYYEKYLIGMHLISLRFLFRNLNSLRYFVSWFSFRKLKFNFLILFFLKSFIFMPFMYLKRIKYKLLKYY